MKVLKKNDRLIDIENQTAWTFLCKTRGPDILRANAKPITTWTCVLQNKQGERRFIPETKLAEFFQVKEAEHSV